MDEIKIQARAKINIALDVLGKRDDGYHEVSMIMHQVDLYDLVNLKRIGEGIKLRTNCGYLPVDEGNIAYKAAKLMIETYGIKEGVEINIEKNIPVAAEIGRASCRERV